MSNYTHSTNFATKDAVPSGDPLKIVKGTEINTEFVNISTAIATKADLLSPTFTGTPALPTGTTAVTQSAGNNSTALATTAYADAAITAERTATATLTNKTLTSPTVSSPTMTGTPVAPTAAVDTNTTQVATTAFVVAQIADDAPTKSGTGAVGNWGINVTGNAATVTTITTTQVANATAGVTAGGVGTYMLARYNSTPTIDFGVTVAGSDLTPSNATGNNVGSAVTGTWRCMGFVGTGTSANLVTLFLRIS
jgi:hypothetical protein